MIFYTSKFRWTHMKWINTTIKKITTVLEEILIYFNVTKIISPRNLCITINFENRG